MKITITVREVLVMIEEAETLLSPEDAQPRNRRRRRTAEEIAAETQPAPAPATNNAASTFESEL